METKEPLYYIKGVRGRGEECIEALKEKYEISSISLSCDNPYCLYIVRNGVLLYVPKYSLGYDLVIEYGIELHLPEKPKALKWSDIKKAFGYTFDGHCPVSIPIIDYHYINVYATKQQAKSAQAAAMISQIREQGEDVYGEIVTLGKNCYILVDTQTYRGIEALFCIQTTHGGLLRFETKELAELFLENNHELVEEYLKTF